VLRGGVVHELVAVNGPDGNSLKNGDFDPISERIKMDSPDSISNGGDLRVLFLPRIQSWGSKRKITDVSRSRDIWYNQEPALKRVHQTAGL
jgi:hypothetical protein